MKRDDAIFTDCAHSAIKRQNSGNMVWYACVKCGEKFEISAFDGKVKVLPPDDPKGPEITE